MFVVLCKHAPLLYCPLVLYSLKRMSNPTATCAQCLCMRFLADDKMANISLDVHTFIAQNLPKYRFQSSLAYTFLSLSASSIIFKGKSLIFLIFVKKSGGCIFLSRVFTITVALNVNRLNSINRGSCKHMHRFIANHITLYIQSVVSHCFMYADHIRENISA